MPVTSNNTVARICISTLALVMLLSSRAAALERICDPAYEDCRTPLLSLIDNERVGIDVAFWFMEDAKYSAALIRRFQAGVPVRIVFDSEGIGSSGTRKQILDDLAAAGIPLRDKTSSGNRALENDAVRRSGHGAVQARRTTGLSRSFPSSRT